MSIYIIYVGPFRSEGILKMDVKFKSSIKRPIRAFLGC